MTGPERVWADRAIYCSDDDHTSIRCAAFGEQHVEPTLEHVPAGLLAAALHVGVSGHPGELDFSLVRLPRPAAAAALYTQSLCPSPAVSFNRRNTSDGLVELVCVVSKNACAFTASADTDVQRIADTLAHEFAIPVSRIMVSCTGVIGRPLPIERVLAGMAGISHRLSPAALARVPEAIMTTDKRPKCASIRLGRAVIGGYAKGAGMVEPQLATMLVYLYTNVTGTPEALKRALSAAANRTFNALSVDTDTSTSDTVALFATGEVEPISAEDFELALTAVCLKLARAIAREAEGATKLLEVRVGVPTSRADAALFAKKVVNSPLVKTALHGSDPNWGRIVAALGKPARGADLQQIDPAQLVIRLQHRTVYDRGQSLEPDLPALSRELATASTVRIDVEIGQPLHRASVWGCDLSAEYVAENADYTS